MKKKNKDDFEKFVSDLWNPPSKEIKPLNISFSPRYMQSYICPVNVYDDSLSFIKDAIKEQEAQREAQIMEVIKTYVDVDKEELIKALQYDREQYKKGFKDGIESIPRCKDCKYYQENFGPAIASREAYLIAAHEICIKWGRGCKTRPDGYCHMWEEEKDEDEDE